MWLPENDQVRTPSQWDVTCGGGGGMGEINGYTVSIRTSAELLFKETRDSSRKTTLRIPGVAGIFSSIVSLICNLLHRQCGFWVKGFVVILCWYIAGCCSKMVITAQWHYLLVESAFTVHFLFMKLLTVDTILGDPRVKERVKPSGADSIKVKAG
nr:MAG: hypothetical protein EDM05_20825 [Leptolyngbya sp. IPPAS B-1204]